MSKKDLTLRELTEYLVSLGRKKGADEVEVAIVEGYEFGVDVRFDDIEKRTQRIR